MATPVLRLALATLLILSSVPLPTAAEAPMADAGLDQTVTKGTTVQLDATGSWDPDGSITEYRWQILDPDGDSIDPACGTCGETTFVGAIVGTYGVRVTVTDDSGKTATDTLYVEVEPGEPPTLVLTGPTNLRTDQVGTYTAEATAGDAALETLVWFVDGTPVRTTNVSGDDATSTIQRQFPTTGDHVIAVRVTDIDDQRTSRTVQTQVSGNIAGPVSGGGGGVGARGTASIHGPRLLTGEGPFDASYTLTGTHIDSVSWWKDGAKFADGQSASTSFSPGDHNLHARVTYTDGTTGIGRFEDGTTRIVVDPAPEINTTTLEGMGGLNVSTTATDEYANLQRFELRLDDTVVFSREPELLQLQKDSYGSQLELDTIDTTIEPGRYTATLVATDGRGQVTRTEQPVEVVGPPEIVRSEVVTDGDLDVYHPRIDPERYTARYEVEIDFNGADPKLVTAEWDDDSPIKLVANGYCEPSRRISRQRLVITKCLANPDLGGAEFFGEVYWNRTGLVVGFPSVILHTTPSNPEIRIQVISGGAGPRGKQWGLVIDASDSFDPDGTPLDFKWFGGAVAVNTNGTIGKLDSYRDAQLVVDDGNDGRTSLDAEIPKYFNPKIGRTVMTPDETFRSDEEVTFIVASRPYELPKGNYRPDVNIGLDIEGPGSVVDHWVYYGDKSGDVRNQSDSYELYRNVDNYDQQFWTVKVPASAFLNGTPSFETYNKYHRTITERSSSFPTPKVLVPGSPKAKNTEIETDYLVEEPVFAERSTVYESRLAELTDRGFQIIGSRDSGTEWQFERRELVSPAVHETDNATFTTRGTRSTFLDLNPDWSAGGSVDVVSETTQTVTEWRDGHGGRGEFTGESRSVKIQPRKYRVENQYRYSYTTTEQRTRTVTKIYEYSDRISYTDTVERCNRYIGCYETTVTKTKWVTRTGTRDIEKTYTVDVTRHATYWAETKRHYSHTYTGRTQQQIIQETQYKTQYEYLYTESVERTETRYLAERTRLVEPAKYEWRPYRTTRSPLLADELSTALDIRLSGTSAVTEWTLQKETGSELKSYSDYSNESRVKETAVSISGEIITPYLDPKTGEVEDRVRNESTHKFQRTGYLDEEDIIEIYLAHWMEVESK